MSAFRSPAAWDVAAWGLAKWQDRRDLLARLELLLLQFARLAAAPPVAPAMRQLGPVLPAVLIDRLLQLQDKQAKARHPGGRPPVVPQVAGALLAAFADPSSGLIFETLKNGTLNRDKAIQLLLDSQGVKTSRTTLRRAVAALDSGKSDGPA